MTKHISNATLLSCYLGIFKKKILAGPPKRDSVVGVATRYGLDGPGIETR